MASTLTSWAANALLKFSRFQTTETHGQRFLELAAKARLNITEIIPAEAVVAVRNDVALLDVREKDEFQRGHIPKALNLPRGTIELEIERHFPDIETELVLYCGAGNRSALAAESLQRMGYRKVRIIAGGLQAWIDAGFSARQNINLMEE